jgi:hypothetical protein
MPCVPGGLLEQYASKALTLRLKWKTRRLLRILMTMTNHHTYRVKTFTPDEAPTPFGWGLTRD